MPVKGATAVKRYLSTIRSDIEEKKTVQALTAVGQIGMASAVYYAPIEYSTLVNSRRQGVSMVGGKWTFTGGFYVEYASYLEYNPNWSPRPPDKKAGPGFNPRARPGFLKYGFENNQSKRQMNAVLQSIYKGGL